MENELRVVNTIVMIKNEQLLKDLLKKILLHNTLMQYADKNDPKNFVFEIIFQSIPTEPFEGSYYINGIEYYTETTEPCAIFSDGTKIVRNFIELNDSKGWSLILDHIYNHLVVRDKKIKDNVNDHAGFTLYDYYTVEQLSDPGLWSNLLGSQ